MASPTARSSAPSRQRTQAGSTGRIAVHGLGRLAESLCETLATERVGEALPTPGRYDLVVVADATSPSALLTQANRWLREHHGYGLPVHATWEAVTIGPMLLPGRTGCYECLQLRMRAARAGGPPPERELWDRLASGQLAAPEPVLTVPLLAMVAALVDDEYERLRTGQPVGTQCAVLRVGSEAATIDRHTFLPSPFCQVCGEVPDDDAALAAITLQPRPKANPTSYRVGPAPDRAALMATFVDARTGLVPQVSVRHHGCTVTSTASIYPTAPPPYDRAISGYARTLDHESSVSTALLEALERYAGVTADLGKRTVVEASYRDLPEGGAVDPRSLGLPGREQVDKTEHYTSYHPDLTMHWVWGWSFGRSRPILVPESIGYYHYRRPPFIAYECSNGCALGGYLEEATLYGIFEIAERDAFLLTWYARLPVPRVDWRSVADPLTRLLATRLEARTGARLHLLNTTMPDGVPSVAAVALNEDDRPGMVKALFGAGAHLDPERAIRQAVREVSMAEVRQPPSGAELDQARAMLADPELVTELEHHPLMYFLPEAGPRLSFLTEGDITTLDEAFPPPTRYTPSPDLSDDLRHTIGHYLANDLDIIAVDQTPQDQRAAGLACVKVIIPGAVPMTFGHRNRRTAGLPRLHTMPARLGYRDDALPTDGINPHPHPFP